MTKDISYDNYLQTTGHEYQIYRDLWTGYRDKATIKSTKIQ